MGTWGIKQTKVVFAMKERLVIRSNGSDITILRDPNVSIITAELKAKVCKRKNSKIRKKDTTKELWISVTNSTITIENNFYDWNYAVASDLLISIPKNNNILKEVIVITKHGDISVDSFYKNLTLKSGDGDIYLSSNDDDMNFFEDEIKRCNSIITAGSGDVFLKLYDMPIDITYKNNCQQIKKKIKDPEETENSFKSNILIDHGTLFINSKICR